MEERKWCVYRHTFPDGKVYIGITGQAPEQRWGKNGLNYQNQGKVFSAILEYGWRNIQHEILFYGLSEKEALMKETELIKESDRKGGFGNYNTAFSVHEKQTKERLTGDDAVITEASLEKNGRFITNMPDSYYDKMISKYGCQPFNAMFKEDGVLLEFWKFSDNDGYDSLSYEIPYPKSEMTFGEAKKWLVETDEKGTMIKRSTFTNEQIENAMLVFENIKGGHQYGHL